jgi:hypothetical protein
MTSRVTIARSAHSPLFEPPATMSQMMQEDVLTGSTSLGDRTEELALRLGRRPARRAERQKVRRVAARQLRLLMRRPSDRRIRLAA